MNKKSGIRKILITSMILVGYIATNFASTGQAVMDNINTNDLLSSMNIEQSILEDNNNQKNEFLTSLFGISKVSANLNDDLNQIYKDLTDIKGTTFEQVIVKAYSLGIIKGYTSEAKFKPDAGVSFVESLAIISNTLDKKLEVPKFASSNDSHWSDKYKTLYNSQDKTTLRNYSNDDGIHRDFAIYLMLRHIGIEFNQDDYSKFQHSFKDVSIQSKFAPYIAFAYENGITQGYSEGPLAGKFGVNSNITRGEITAFSFKVLNMKDALQSAYKNKTGRTASISATSTTIVEKVSSTGSSSNSGSSGGGSSSTPITSGNNTGNTAIGTTPITNIGTGDSASSGGGGSSISNETIQIQGKYYTKNLFNDPTKTERDYNIYIIGQEFNSKNIGTIKSGTVKYNDLKRVIFSSESKWNFRNGAAGGAQLEKIPGMDYEKKLTENEKIDWLKEAVVKEGFVLIDKNKVNDQIKKEIKDKGIKFSNSKESNAYFKDKYNEITRPLLDGKDYLGYFQHDGNLSITWYSQDGSKTQRISANELATPSNIKYPLSHAGEQGYDNLSKESTLINGRYVFEFFYSR